MGPGYRSAWIVGLITNDGSVGVYSVCSGRDSHCLATGDSDGDPVENCVLLDSISGLEYQDSAAYH